MVARSNAKHRQVYQYIHNLILSGEYAVGEQIPTETELATRFGASRVTVARALRDLQQQGYLVRRRGAGSFVRQRRLAASTLLGLITSDRPGIFSRIAEEMARVAHANGFGLLLGKWPANENDVDEIMRYTESICDQYIARKVSGVFFTPMQVHPDQMEFNAHIAEAFESTGVAVVLLDRDVVDFPRRSRFDLVGIDNRCVGYLLAEHLWKLGYRRIEFVTHDLAASTVNARIAGYQDLLAEQGIQPDPAWVHRGDTSSPEFVGQIVRDRRPEALVCVNDHVAANLIRSLGRLGVRVPEDVAIVGVDDDDVSELLSVALSTIRQPCVDLGTAAILAMTDRLANPRLPAREVCVASQLVIRESCGAALRSRRDAASG